MQPISSSGSTVVLIGSLSWPQNLYLARAIHEAGWSVHLLSEGEQPKDLAPWLTLLPLSQGEGVLASKIRRLHADPEIKWILPLDEEALLAAHHALEDRSKLLHDLPAEHLQMLQKKTRMGAFAATVGVNVPDWQPVQSKEQALSQAAEWGYPIVLKGEAGSAGNEVVICHEAAALASALTWLSGHTVFLQRHVRGANWGCGAFFHKGQITHVHCYEILKQQPAGVGAACLVRHDLEPAAVSAVADMGAALQWTGYFQCDFIRDDAGAFWFLEINPRPWGSMTAALASGIPIFQPLIDTLSGRTPVPDIVDNRGWTGGVFPKPLPHMAVMGEWFSMAMTVLSPSFWRGFPRTHRSLLTYFAKVTYWNARWALRHRPDRQKHAAERKHSGINLNAG